MEELGDSIDVLHVDDEPDFADMAATFVEREDDRFDVETTTSAGEGLDRLADDSFDCIVSDFDMPGQNGIQFLEDVREVHPDLPFILYTGKGSEEIASDAISAGVTDYLQKASGADQYTVLANRILNAVSARRSAREAERRRHSLEQTLKTVPACVVRIDSDGEFVLANERAEGVLGLEPSEVETRSYNDPEWNIRDLNGDPIPDEELPFRRVLDTGEPITGFQHTIDWPDGTRKILLVNGAPLFDNEGAVESTVFALTDITERKEREHKRELIIDRVTDAIVEVDSDWRFTLVNDHAEELYDMNEEDLLGRDLWEVFEEAQDTRFEEEYRRVMETREPTSFVEYYSGLDGWFDVKAYPKDDGGIAFYFIEVTERRERQHELERQNERFKYVEEIADIGYWEIDPQTPWPHDVTLSDGVYHVHELPPDEPFTVERGLQFYHPEDRPQVRRAVERAIADGQPYDIEVRLVTAGGRERWIHTVGEPVERDGEVVTVRGVFQDITARKEQEEVLAQQNERLEAFASVVSHDIRNPLSVAEGRIELAREDCESEHLVEAADAVARSQELIDNLLTLARAGEELGSVDSVDLADTVEGCWQNVETADATLEVETEQVIRADRRRLQQLLENLVRNAVDHGGADVSVTVGELDDGFYVADDGAGIPGDEREDVFEVGYSTADESTGFGLVIVRQIVEAHDWEVGVAEGERGGTRVEITEVERVGDAG